MKTPDLITSRAKPSINRPFKRQLYIGTLVEFNDSVFILNSSNLWSERNSVMKTNSNRKKRKVQGAEISHVVDHLNRDSRAASSEMKKMAKNMDKLLERRANCGLEQNAGLIFEEHHAGTFNKNARLNGDYIATAKSGSSGGFANDQRTDIRIFQGDQVVAEAQSKCCKNPGRTAAEISNSKYSGTQRIVPSKQKDEVKSMLQKGAKSKANNPSPLQREKGLRRAEAASKTSDRVKHGKNSSDPINRERVLDITKNGTKDLKFKIEINEVANEAAAGAKAGALVGGAISTLSNTLSACKGQQSAADATKNIVKDTATSAVKGAAVSATGALIRQGFSASTKLGRLAKGSAPMAIGGCVVELGVQAVKGELSAKTATKTVATAGATFAAAEAGAALGTFLCPGVGTVIGGLAGGLLGSLGASSIFK
jgi:hypothetical protein